MELKDYQADAIESLERFLGFLGEGRTISDAFRRLWESQNVEARPPYDTLIDGVPVVTFKVPTGGGKTFMAAASIKPIFDAFPARDDAPVVVWLVPSDAILTQTLKNLSNPSHPYHERMARDFGGRVAVYSKEQALSGERFTPATLMGQLSVLVMSYDSFRTANKEGRKVYQQNGELAPFAARYMGDVPRLDGADDDALISVIRNFHPLVIVDESHHARTDLSIEMLKNLNPSFVLELTATPKKSANVIAYVSASRLKAADMVKLPVIVYNRPSEDDVMSDAISLRASLEKMAKEEAMRGKVPVRPIVLFQAESKSSGKGGEDRATFDEVKRRLVEEHGIDESQIAIKTAKINELKGIDLLSADCGIRYIITINALKEGWDCPFAYILASLAPRSSAVDVEQVLGRVLRRPYTMRFERRLLNYSYVFTSSAVFAATLGKIVEGLNGAGFSERDYRAVDMANGADDEDMRREKDAHRDVPKPEQMEIDFGDAGEGGDAADDGEKSEAHGDGSVPPHEAPTEDTKDEYHANDMNGGGTGSIIKKALAQGADYDKKSDESDDVPPEVKERMTEIKIRDVFAESVKDIRLPQFFMADEGDSLFGAAEPSLLEKENLWTGFKLSEQDTVIDFGTAGGTVVSVDISDGDDFPRARRLSEQERERFMEYFTSLPDESKKRQCIDMF
ncbi:MAG: DEAD/DEAH box helicase, partial [Selenomonadaceae bacterium]